MSGNRFADFAAGLCVPQAQFAFDATTIFPSPATACCENLPIVAEGETADPVVKAPGGSPFFLLRVDIPQTNFATVAKPFSRVHGTSGKRNDLAVAAPLMSRSFSCLNTGSPGWSNALLRQITVVEG